MPPLNLPASAPCAPASTNPADRCWTADEVEALLALPFPGLLFRAQQVHREHFDPARVQLSTLLSVKTGGCPEDCAYCSQSRRFDTGVEDQAVLPVDEVVAAARQAKEAGATRFCMGAAWRGPKQRDLESVLDLVKAVKALGMETCATLGLLRDGQAEQLRDAGLDYYNHNLDTSPGLYGDIISTRTYQDRLDTLARVRDAGLRVCCGGIVGIGDDIHHRAGLIAQLANLDPYPESVPINALVQVPGTPLYGSDRVDIFDFVRVIAVARITMPRAYVRLSAGRTQMTDEGQALCFLAGANSIFYGDRLLTTDNPQGDRDRALFARLGMQPA